MLADFDDAMFAVPVILWLAGPETVLALAGVLTPIAALWIGLTRLADRHRASSLALPPVNAITHAEQPNRGLLKQRHLHMEPE